MPPPNISITLATENDAPALASIMTAAFSASDAAYPLIWGSAEPGTHDMIALKGLFSPVQKEGRVTYKAIDASKDGKVVGFATWNLPKEKKNEVGTGEKAGGLPELPGVNMELWGEKVGGPRAFYDMDVDAEEDMLLSFFFVLPEHQRQGIGSMLLEWGKQKGDELGRNIWLTSTPQARTVYDKNGWRVMENYGVDLAKFGGEGSYVRSWMMRSPAS